MSKHASEGARPPFWTEEQSEQTALAAGHWARFISCTVLATLDDLSEVFDRFGLAAAVSTAWPQDGCSRFRCWTSTRSTVGAVRLSRYATGP